MVEVQTNRLIFNRRSCHHRTPLSGNGSFRVCHTYCDTGLPILASQVFENFSTLKIIDIWGCFAVDVLAPTGIRIEHPTLCMRGERVTNSITANNQVLHTLINTSLVKTCMHCLIKLLPNYRYILRINSPKPLRQRGTDKPLTEQNSQCVSPIKTILDFRVICC